MDITFEDVLFKAIDIFFAFNETAYKKQAEACKEASKNRTKSERYREECKKKAVESRENAEAVRQAREEFREKYNVK